ncbi:hypothetical protein [Nonomuraea sp. NPDC049309]|uniref:hypothetical protein n=1 Tax=Nonomuraea sp. NPDC049309 TaxID=3364350 RepID=UPI0037208BFB
MTDGHDVQVLSDVDIYLYEAVAAQVVESGGARLDRLTHASGLSEEEVRESLGTLMEHGYVVPQGHDRYGLGPHTFEVEY